MRKYQQPDLQVHDVSSETILSGSVSISRNEYEDFNGNNRCNRLPENQTSIWD